MVRSCANTKAVNNFTGFLAVVSTMKNLIWFVPCVWERCFVALISLMGRSWLSTFLADAMTRLCELGGSGTYSSLPWVGNWDHGLLERPCFCCDCYPLLFVNWREPRNLISSLPVRLSIHVFFTQGMHNTWFTELLTAVVAIKTILPS